MTPIQDAEFLVQYAKEKLFFTNSLAKEFAVLYAINKIYYLKDKKRLNHWQQVKQIIETYEQPCIRLPKTI